MSAWNDTSAQPYALVSFPTHPLISLILPYVSRENSMFAQKPHVLSKKPHVFSKKPHVYTLQGACRRGSAVESQDSRARFAGSEKIGALPEHMQCSRFKILWGGSAPPHTPF